MESIWLIGVKDNPTGINEEHGEGGTIVDMMKILSDIYEKPFANNKWYKRWDLDIAMCLHKMNPLMWW